MRGGEGERMRGRGKGVSRYKRVAIKDISLFLDELECILVCRIPIPMLEEHVLKSHFLLMRLPLSLSPTSPLHIKDMYNEATVTERL